MRVQRAPQSEVDDVAGLLGPRIARDGSLDAGVDRNARWRDAVGKHDACVSTVDRHRPVVAGDVPVQLVERAHVAAGEKEAYCVRDAVADDDLAIGVSRARNPDAERLRPAGILALLIDVKALSRLVGDVAERDLELGRAALRGVVVKGEIANDPVPLAGEANRQLLGNVERSVGEDSEQRIEIADANGAVGFLRARWLCEREERGEEEEAAALPQLKS